MKNYFLSVLTISVSLFFTGCFAPAIQYQDKNSISINHLEKDIGDAMTMAKEYCIKNGYTGITPTISIPDRARRTTTFECK